MAIHFILIVGHETETANYRMAISSANCIPIVTDSMELLYEARKNPDSPHSILTYTDALILPGGGDISPNIINRKNPNNLRISNAHFYNVDEDLDLIQLSYFEYFYMQNKPIIGICKGMQLINFALGGTLISDLSDDKKLLHTAKNKFDRQHSCNYELRDDIVLLNKLFRGQMPTTVNSAHHQAIGKLGEDLYAFSHASDGTVEGIIHTMYPILGLQWHPERKLCPDGNYLKLYTYRLLHYFAQNQT